MPKQYVPKTDIWDDGKKSSWDKEAKPKKDPKLDSFRRRCKVCGIYLLTQVEEKIGVHVGCVQDNYARERKLSIVRGRPRYGST